MAVLGSRSLIVLVVFVDCGRKATLNLEVSATQLRSCVRPQVAVLGSPSLIVLMVSVHVKQLELYYHRTQELCESGGGRPGLPVPNIYINYQIM